MRFGPRQRCGADNSSDGDAENTSVASDPYQSIDSSQGSVANGSVARGMGLFDLASRANHSCVPSARLCYVAGEVWEPHVERGLLFSPSSLSL